MPKYHWLGGTVNLGRFGTVRRGDTLNLTEKEEESITGNGPGGSIDPRFQAHKENAKIDGAGLDLPEGFERLTREGQSAARQQAEEARRRTEALASAVNPKSGTPGAGAAGQPLPPLTDEQKEAARTRAQEEARAQQLAAANANTDLENYREMTKAELNEVVEELRRSGTPVEGIKNNSSRNAILRAVLIAKGLNADEVPDDGAE